MCDAFPQNLLSAREEKALGTVRRSALVEEASRPSGKWLFTLLVEGTQRSLEGHSRARGTELKQLPHCLLFKALFHFPVLGSNPKAGAEQIDFAG